MCSNIVGIYPVVRTVSDPISVTHPSIARPEKARIDHP
jgi:hypothetical protein